MDGPPAVAMYTATAIGAVLLMALVAGLALHVAHTLRLIGSEQRIKLGRRLRIVFGATFLMAAVTPYVALNFSTLTLTVFVSAAGLIVAGWVWGASPTGNFEVDSKASEAR